MKVILKVLAIFAFVGVLFFLTTAWGMVATVLIPGNVWGAMTLYAALPALLIGFCIWFFVKRGS